MRLSTLLSVIALIALFAFIATQQAPLSVVNQPVHTQEQPLRTEFLDNGLQVTVKEVHTLPLVSIQFWVRVGSRNEPDGYQGIAHVFEHMWFKGTATQPVGSFHKRVERLGGELNAMTSHDWTMYYVTVPSDKFDDIYPYMVDLLLNNPFDETELKKEIEVIIEEQRMQFNTPEKYTDERFGLLLLEEHPYRHPIIGYKNTINASTPEQIRAFYHTWYVPNNMNIVIVGDVDTETTVNKIASTLGQLQPRELPQAPYTIEQGPSAPKYNSSERNLGFHYIAVGYVAPNSQHEDRYAMEVLNAVLVNGESSRLNRVLKNEKNLITRALGVYAPLIDLGVIETIIVVDPDKRNDAVTALLLELNKMKFQPVTDEELERAKTLIKADHLRKQEEVLDIGMEIGHAWVKGTLDDLDDYLNNIDAVTTEDVQRVANTYMKQHTMYEVKPKK